MKKDVLTICLFLSIVYPEEFRQLNIEGLSSSRILSIAQDSTGFIWLGTDEGLNRFDGHKNKIYRSNIFDEKTISGNRVWKTHVDENNTLWVVTDRGVCFYEAEADRFHRINTGSRPLHHINQGENIYFTTSSHGVWAINKTDKKITKYQFDPLDPFSLSSSKFSTKQTKPLALDGETLWVGTTNGLNKVNINTGQAKRLYSGKTNLVKGDTITSILVENDILYIGTTNGLGLSDLVFGENMDDDIGSLGNTHILNQFNIKETGHTGILVKNEIVILNRNKIAKNIKTERPLTKVKDLKTGQYLLTSEEHKKGILLTTGEPGEKEHYSQPTQMPLNAKEILLDKEGGIWMVGESGVLRRSNTKNPASLTALETIPDETFSRLNHELFVLKGNKTIVYGENLKPKTTHRINTSTVKQVKRIHVSGEKDVYLFDREIFKLAENNANILLASFNTPINKVASNKKSLFISLKNSGMAHYDIEKKIVTDYRKNRLLSKFLPAGASSFYIKGNTLWVGNDESGLYELDIKKPASPRLVKHHTHIQTNPRSFSSSSVSCIIENSTRLFIGTNGDGLFVYDGMGNFDKTSISDGLPSNNIVSLTFASDTTIWALTNGGLALVDWEEKNISVVGQTEGLRPFYHVEDALIPQKNGNVHIVSPEGIQTVAASDLFVNEHEATVLVESVVLIDKSNKVFSTNKKNIQATHETPTIRINLTAPSIYKSEETTFTYFIDGYHDAWVDNGTRRYIELQGLNQGTYTAHIKSYNNDSYESKNTATINFSIVPPWWETWWAYASYTAAIFMLFAFYVNYQKRAQAKATEDKRKEEELEEARQFQLDMLPRETPDELGLDISSAIKTATEVGGDYYDYFPQKDGKSLYVVVGDATGHGMTAGMMVSITKAGLYGIPSIPPNDIARRLNRVIKNIDLGWNRMAFNMARFWEDRVEFTSAAMPPVYHYHGETGDLDEVLLGGLPLGSIKDETFSLEEFDFNQGDSLVFISDGLPEAVNHTGEMLGYDAVYNCIKANGNQSAEEQKQSLLDLGNAWLGDLQNQDDITIVVVKKSKPLE